MDSKLSRLADGLLQASWLVAVIAVPLFFNIHSERVFEPDKLTLLRSIAIFMFAVWLVRFVDRSEWQQWRRLGWRARDSIWREPFVLPLAALIVVYLVSTALSVTPRISWAGSYQRLQGTYTTLSYIIIFATMATTLRSRAAVRRVVTAIIIASVPVAFYGLLQHFGLDPLPWGGDVTVRVAGHMGNAIFIAAYLIMAVPLTLARILDAFTSILSDEHLAAADIVRAAVYIFVLAIQLLTIYWSGSRGPLIGLAVALFSFTLVLLVSLRGSASDTRALRGKDVLYALLLVLPAIVALILANTVGSLANTAVAFGLFFGVVILSVLAVFLLVAVRRAWRWLWLSWLALTVFVAGWLLLFNVSAERLVAAEDIPLAGDVASALVEWKELPAVGTYGRMLDPSQTEGREKSNRVRVLIWQGVVDLIRPHEPISFPDGRVDVFNFWRPLIGYGPESMYVAYNRFYPPELATVEARNASPDRAHNETFDALAITGLFGFLAWQALYLTVFYYGFKYLRVVRSRRDRNTLVGLWIAGALAGAAASLLIFDPVYLGVAIPTGTIAGLVLYLIYYAMTSSGLDMPEDDASGRAVPFQSGRLLMNALVAAVLAHYVEIHFGIAIAATRLHFFVYLALMLTISRGLLGAPARDEASGARRGRASGSADVSGGWWRPALTWTFLLGLMVGILGSEFINYVLPPDVSIQTGADLSAGDIFRQSLFVNSQRSFMDSPFIFLMMAVAWVLGVVLVISELIKHEEVPVQLPQLSAVSAQRRYLAAGAFVMWALSGVVLRFGRTTDGSASSTLGHSLALLASVVCLWVAVRLVLDASAARRHALTVAAAGPVLLLPLAVAGAWFYAAIVAVLSVLVLYLLWDKSYRFLLVPPMVMAAAAFAIGVAYTYLQALLVRESLLYLLFYQGVEPVSTLFNLFFRPEQVPASVLELRVLEAQQATRYISAFYVFLFSMLIAAGLSLAWPRWRHERKRGPLWAYATTAVLLVLAAVTITQTNLRGVQADMLYKRGRPFDVQAATTGDPLAWDVAIAIYEKAIALTPWEDYYYLFLGRAYLERSGLALDAAEQTALLREAEVRLRAAQEINPLNVDHTANLARLNTRSIISAPDDVVRTERLDAAERYYQEALALSPQNSVIRNEYARLILDLRQDCAQSVDIYNQSLAIDPFYRDTYFALSDALVQCAAMQSDATAQTSMYSAAVDSLYAGLQVDPESAPAWLQAAQLYLRLGLGEEALTAIDNARAYDSGGRLATWNVDFLEAQTYQQLGQEALARALAEQALTAAPPDATVQIEQFLAALPQS